MPRPITLLEDSWLSSGLVVGCLFGTLISALTAHKVGCKRALILFSILILITFGSFAFFQNILLFLIGRVVMGVGVGSILCLLPSYIGEITDESNRGQAGSVFGIVFTIGHIINYCVGPFISFQALNLIHLVPLLLFYLTFVPFVPESPYYYMFRNNEKETKRSLRKFRGHPAIGNEFEQIKLFTEKSQDQKIIFRNLIRSEIFLKGLWVACGLLMCQPVTGFTAILAYLQPIFEANKDFISPEYSVLIIGFCPFLTTICTTFFVDKLGRKALLLISSVGAAICLLLLSVYFYLQNNGFNISAVKWLPVLLVIIFVVTNNVGFASMPWIMSAEMFSSDIKSIGTGIASSVNMIVTLIITAIFPYMSSTLGMSGSFLIFSGFSILAITFIIIVVPETKGKSFNEIQELLKPNNNIKEFS